MDLLTAQVNILQAFNLKGSDLGAQCCVDYNVVLFVCLGFSYLGL